MLLTHAAIPHTPAPIRQSTPPQRHLALKANVTAVVYHSASSTWAEAGALCTDAIKERMDGTDTNGIIAIGKTQRVEFASGLGNDAGVQAAVLALHREAGAGRMQAIASKKLVVLSFNSGDSAVYLLHASANEETLLAFVASVDFAYTVLNQLVSSLSVVDDEARLRFINPASASILGLKPGEGIGKPVVDVIANTRLHEVVRSGNPEYGRLDFQGKTRIVSRRPIRDGGKVIGAIGQVLFKEPEDLHELSREIARLKSEVHYYQRELSVARTQVYGLQHIIGSSPAIRELKSQIARIAPLDVPVLLTGESGTGKELVAHAIHSLSGRSTRPVVVVNAAALPSNLVESELFGYEPGAFTGAERKGRKGKFENADKSTLFLDEICDMPMDVQVKLLRVLQDGVFERIGSDRPRYSGFRLICASNRDVQRMIAQDKFRMDLYYRISGVTLKLPALRDRLEDLPLLVESFIEAFSRRHQTPVKRVDAPAYEWLCQQPWPGNVRQLLHEVERAAIFCDGDVLTVDDFRRSDAPAVEPQVGAAQAGTISAARESMELKLIREALIRHKGNKSRVADELGISRSHLYKKLAVLASDGS
jgi:transcriptional regulator with PAS, ATPase and Fis domain